MAAKYCSSTGTTFKTCWIIILIGLVKTTSQRVIVSPVPFDYQCNNEPGTFPHASDCQRFWLCQPSSLRANEITSQTGKPVEVDLIAHLFKCPNGYNFDTKIRFCQRKEDVACGQRNINKPPPPAIRDLGLLGLILEIP